MKEDPVTAVAVVTLVTTGVGLFTVRTKVAVPVPLGLVAPIMMLDVPLATGVPDMSPEVEFSDRPAGNPVALKLVGELVAAIV